MYFTCSLNFNLLSLIPARSFNALFNSILMPPTITTIFSTISRPLIRTASVLCAASVKPATSNHAPTFRIAAFVFYSISLTVLATETMAISFAKPTIVVPFGNGSRSTTSYIMFHSSGPSTEPCKTSAVTTYSYSPSSVRYINSLA